jgi:HK97 family phage portal protein
MGKLAHNLRISANDLLGTDWLKGEERDHWSGYTFPGGMSAAGVRVSADAVERIATAQACIRLLSETVAYLSLDVFERKPDGQREKSAIHPLSDLLSTQTNTWQTAFQFIAMSMRHLVMRGNAYSRILPGPRGPVDQLIPLHPDRMTVEQRDDRSLLYHYVTKKGKRETYFQDEVFHVGGLSDDGIIGLAQLNLGRDVFGTAIATEAYGASMYRNGAQLGGILSKKQPGALSDTARQNIQNDLRKFTGAGNAFKTMILEEDLEFKAISMRARDAEFLLSRKFSVTEICRIFRIPPHMVADLDRSTNNNIEEQGIEFVVYTLGPWLKLWEQAIQRDLILAKHRFFAEFNVNSLLRGDIQSRYTAYGIGIEKGFLTRNEVRRKENMNDIDGLDTPLRPLNMGNGAEPPAEEEAGADRMEMFVRSAADRLANKEITAVRKAIQRFAGDQNGLDQWLDEFYLGFTADIHNGLIVPYAIAEEFAVAARQSLRAASTNGGSSLTLIVDRWEATRAGALATLGLLKGEVNAVQ